MGKKQLWDIKYIPEVGMIFTPGKHTPEEFVEECRASWRYSSPRKGIE